MSQKNFQIFRSQISDLKTDNVDYLKKPPWKNFFFDIFVIHLSSRYEKRCRMLQRLFSLFQGSKNQLCRCNTTPTSQSCSISPFMLHYSELAMYFSQKNILFNLLKACSEFSSLQIFLNLIIIGYSVQVQVT